MGGCVAHGARSPSDVTNTFADLHEGEGGHALSQLLPHKPRALGSPRPSAALAAEPPSAVAAAHVATRDGGSAPASPDAAAAGQPAQDALMPLAQALRHARQEPTSDAELDALARAFEPLSVNSCSSASKRTYWTPDEIDALREAEAKHAGAPNKWAAIKADVAYEQSLGRRSNTDLCSKAASLRRKEERDAARASARSPAPSAPQLTRLASPPRAPAQPSPRARKEASPRTPQPQQRQGAAPSLSSACRGERRAWTREETDALCGGLARYGEGRWVEILDDPQYGPALANRSNVNLKDKHRQMQSQRGAPRPRGGGRAPAEAPSSARRARSAAGEVGAEAEPLERGPLPAHAPDAAQAEAPLPPVPLTLPRAEAAGGAAPDENRLPPIGDGVDLVSLPARRRYLGFIPALVQESAGREMSTAAVRTWLQRHREHCPIGPQDWGQFQVDHIVSRKLGGHNHPSNYFLLEAGANLRFKHYVDREKERVVGQRVWRIALAFAAFCRQETVARGVDYSAFPIADFM